MKRAIKTALSGIAAGAVCGVLGTGGGVILVPLLTAFCELKEDEIFPSCICIMLPVCLVCLMFTEMVLPWKEIMPYMIGGAIGGAAACGLGKRISVHWLRIGLGIFMIWGGIRNLWS